MAEGFVPSTAPTVLQRLARDLLGRRLGERLPRVHDYAARFRAGNGTIQAAMRELQGAGAVRLETRGHLGTFIRDLDYTKLWGFTGMGVLACAMPLPYSARFEGLATGLYTAFKAAGIPFGLSFVRGAGARIQAVADGRCEVAVVSRLAAEHAVAAGRPVTVGARLGPGTYLSAHAFMWAGQPPAGPYPPDLKVGYDADSLDQELLVAAEFAGCPIRPVPMTYSRLHLALKAGEIDVAPYNADEVRPEWGLAVTAPRTPPGRALLPAGGEAVLVVHAERPEVVRLFHGTVDVNGIARVQAEVMAGRLAPSF